MNQGSPAAGTPLGPMTTPFVAVSVTSMPNCPAPLPPVMLPIPAMLASTEPDESVMPLTPPVTLEMPPILIVPPPPPKLELMPETPPLTAPVLAVKPKVGVGCALKLPGL